MTEGCWWGKPVIKRQWIVIFQWQCWRNDKIEKLFQCFFKFKNTFLKNFLRDFDAVKCVQYCVEVFNIGLNIWVYIILMYIWIQTSKSNTSPWSQWWCTIRIVNYWNCVNQSKMCVFVVKWKLLLNIFKEYWSL